MIRWTIAATVLSSLFLFSLPVLAGDVSADPKGEFDVPSSVDCRDQISFADALRGQGDSYRAITEYKRVIHFCSDDSLRTHAQASIGDVLFEAGRYGLVVDWYRGLGTEDAPPPHAGLLAGRSLFRLGHYDDAVGVLSPLHSHRVSSAQTGEASYYAGLSQIRTGRFRQAEGSLALVGDASPYSDRAHRHLYVLSNAPRPNRKSPGVAAALAVVPGVGYAYAEHYGTAFASLIVNGLLCWATVDAFHDGYDGAGGFYSLLAFGFYLGNITGSAQSADRYNAYQEERFQARFQE